MDATKLNWAVGENSHKAEDPEILDSSARKIIWFDIIEFLNYAQGPWAIDPNNLSYKREKKLKTVKKHFENGGWMDPTDVQGTIADLFEGATDERLVVEGRHRLVAALLLGETYAPFSVPLKLVDNLKANITNLDN